MFAAAEVSAAPYCQHVAPHVSPPVEVEVCLVGHAGQVGAKASCEGDTADAQDEGL